MAAGAQLQIAYGNHDKAHSLLAELDQHPGIRNDPVYAGQLPGLVRSALALHESELAAHLADGVQPLLPLQEHALTASQAQLAEAAGNHTEAASLYTDAATRWQQFGNVPEHGYALLGHGRSFVALSQAEAEKPLRQARELFTMLGYKPALTEAETLLAGFQAAAS